MLWPGEQQVVDLTARQGVLRTRDLAAHGLPRTYLGDLVRRGQLLCVSRGLYTLPNSEVSEQHALAEVARRIPHGIVCLLSALRFHDLTMQSPFEVWLAVGIKARQPSVTGLPLRIVPFSSAAWLRTLKSTRLKVCLSGSATLAFTDNYQPIYLR